MLQKPKRSLRWESAEVALKSSCPWYRSEWCILPFDLCVRYCKTIQRSQPWAAMCSFKRAMAIAIWSPRRRSSCLVSLRNLIRLRMRSRAWRYSSSSLACSGHDIARVRREHMKHLLKTSRSNVAARRTKSKHYFRLLFVRRARPAFAVSARQNSQALRASEFALAFVECVEDIRLKHQRSSYVNHVQSPDAQLGSVPAG